MSMQSLKYNYHDSYIDSIEIGETYISLIIPLYEIFYKEKPIVKLTIKNIFNFEKSKLYFSKILLSAEPNGEIGCRINSINYHTKKESTTKNKYIYVDTDWEKEITVHCTNIQEEEITTNCSSRRLWR